MTTVTTPPALDEGLEQDPVAEFEESRRRWEAAERTRSALTVFAIVMAGAALIASIAAWSFAASRSITKVATPAPSGRPVVPPAYAPADVPVTLADYSVGLASLKLTAGTKTLHISNSGMMVHELLVFHPSSSIDPKHLPVGSDGNVDEEAAGVNKVSDGDNIDPGKAQVRSLDLSQPGTYVFVCNLPAHYRLGMSAVVIVVAPTP